MANPQGGQGRPEGQGGHGQTFTSAQHDASLGRRSEGPGVRREERTVEGAESSISVPEGGLGDAGGADRSDMAADARRMENRSFPEEGGGADVAAEDDVEEAGAAMEPQVDQTTGQGISSGG